MRRAEKALGYRSTIATPWGCVRGTGSTSSANRTQHLGTVEAATEKEAIAAAIKQFEIEPARRNRIVLQKIRDND
jgi:hypothetical protein